MVRGYNASEADRYFTQSAEDYYDISDWTTKQEKQNTQIVYIRDENESIQKISKNNLKQLMGIMEKRLSVTLNDEHLSTVKFAYHQLIQELDFLGM